LGPNQLFSVLIAGLSDKTVNYYILTVYARVQC